jgi:hypothetical protein
MADIFDWREFIKKKQPTDFKAEDSPAPPDNTGVSPLRDPNYENIPKKLPKVPQRKGRGFSYVYKKPDEDWEAITRQALAAEQPAAEPIPTTDNTEQTNTDTGTDNTAMTPLQLALKLRDDLAASKADMDAALAEPIPQHKDRGKHGFSLLGFARPTDEEMDTPDNRRWHYELAHSWMLSPQWQDTVQKGVALENQDATAAKAGRDRLSSIAINGFQNRAKRGWDQMIENFKKGHWDTQSREYKEYLEAMQRYWDDAVAAGADTSTWQIPPITAGSSSQALRGDINKEVKNRIDMITLAKELDEYAQKASQGPLSEADRSRYATVFDKGLENAARIISGSNGTLADAEKVRIQYQALPPEAKAIVEANRKKLLDTLYKNMVYVSQNIKSVESKNKLANVLDELNKPSSNFGDAMYKTVAMLTKFLSDEPEIARDITADIALDQFKVFMDSTMQWAIIDPTIIGAYIQQAYDQAYYREAELLERGNRSVDIKPKQSFNTDYTALTKQIMANAPIDKLKMAYPTVREYGYLGNNAEASQYRIEMQNRKKAKEATATAAADWNPF